ncbi:hypothetical protein ANN_05971 [Periplaneta americana]|uniref:Uncharacterized protein n=1 Tax=Periplaneta americana TaxID=6978 RepID=A0ABQ8TDZ0_PERAM|nr:hypothetical protein ANN_05971 [Periplaneta americana]
MAGLCEGGNEPLNSLKAICCCYIQHELRKALREDSFHQWSKLKSKGMGGVFYSHWKKGNSWISTKKGLSSSQWTQAIKMNCNTISVRTLPGRTLDSTRCRRCDEQETFPHVLGFCHHGELLRIKRHNTVRSLIASSIRQNASYEVYEEVGCVSSDGSTRRADIIIIDRQKDKGVILDPTIRFEMHEQQPQEVRHEAIIKTSHQGKVSQNSHFQSPYDSKAPSANNVNIPMDMGIEVITSLYDYLVLTVAGNVRLGQASPLSYAKGCSEEQSAKKETEEQSAKKETEEQSTKKERNREERIGRVEREERNRRVECEESSRRAECEKRNRRAGYEERKRRAECEERIGRVEREERNRRVECEESSRRAECEERKQRGRMQRKKQKSRMRRKK